MTITKSFFPASHIVTHPEMFLLLLLLLPGKVRYVKVQSSVLWAKPVLLSCCCCWWWWCCCCCKVHVFLPRSSPPLLVDAENQQHSTLGLRDTDLWPRPTRRLSASRFPRSEDRVVQTMGMYRVYKGVYIYNQDLPTIMGIKGRIQCEVYMFQPSAQAETVLFEPTKLPATQSQKVSGSMFSHVPNRNPEVTGK